MPDISMCTNFLCELRSKCYRYRAQPSKRQSMSRFAPFEGVCIHFMSLEKIDELTVTEETDKKIRAFSSGVL